MIENEDFNFAAALSGRDKVDILLKNAGFPTIRSVAAELNEHDADVSRVLNNSAQNRPVAASRIRDGIARLAGIDRHTLDELLGGPIQEENGDD